MRPVSTFFNIQLSNSRISFSFYSLCLLYLICSYLKRDNLHFKIGNLQENSKIYRLKRIQKTPLQNTSGRVILKEKRECHTWTRMNPKCRSQY